MEHIYLGLNLTKLNSACLLTELDGIALLMNYSPFQEMYIFLWSLAAWDYHL